MNWFERHTAIGFVMWCITVFIVIYFWGDTGALAYAIGTFCFVLGWELGKRNPNSKW